MPLTFGEWQSWHPVMPTRYLPRSSGRCAPPAPRPGRLPAIPPGSDRGRNPSTNPQPNDCSSCAPLIHRPIPPSDIAGAAPTNNTKISAFAISFAHRLASAPKACRLGRRPRIERKIKGSRGRRPRVLQPDRTMSVTERPAPPTMAGTWLISREGRFLAGLRRRWLAPLAMALVLHWYGDRELDAADLLLSELHLGATYDAVIRGRLWRRMPFDVVAVPLAIVAATFAMMLGEQSILVDDRGPLPGGLASRPAELRHRPLTIRCAWAGRTLTAHDLCSAPPSICRWPPASLYFTNTSFLHEGEQYLEPRLRSRIHSVRWECWPWRASSPTWCSPCGIANSASRRALARAGKCARLRERLRARRMERVVHPGAGGAPRSAVPLLHLRDGATVRWSATRQP